MHTDARSVFFNNTNVDAKLPVRTVYFSGDKTRPAFSEQLTLQEAFDVVGILTMDKHRQRRPFAFVVDAKIESRA